MKPGKPARAHIVQICLIVLICILLIHVSGCQREKAPIKIGFAGDFTGGNRELCINTRNGVLLAVDDVNAVGGINRRKIELIVKDDRLDPATAVRLDQELIREHVVAIVGHLHGEMCQAVLPLATREKMVLISPGAASNRFTGIDDYLFRINSPASGTTLATAKYAYSRGLRNVAVLYDLGNKIYTGSKLTDFSKAFGAMGGRTTSQSFTSGQDVSFPDLVRDLARSRPDGYFIIAGALDTAMICQHLRKIDPSGPILISPLAYHPELIKNGGKAVEGVVLAHSFQKDSQEPAFLKFKEDFFKRYKTTPGMWETFGYEAVMVLAQALKQNSDPKQLKETILKIGRFKGLQGDIVFDRYGDNQRMPLLLTIRKGAFVEIR